MDKPRKKEFDEKLGYDAETNIKCIMAHNHACEDWEAYIIDSLEAILTIDNQKEIKQLIEEIRQKG